MMQYKLPDFNMILDEIICEIDIPDTVHEIYNDYRMSSYGTCHTNIIWEDHDDNHRSNDEIVEYGNFFRISINPTKIMSLLLEINKFHINLNVIKLIMKLAIYHELRHVYINTNKRENMIGILRKDYDVTWETKKIIEKECINYSYDMVRKECKTKEELDIIKFIIYSTRFGYYDRKEVGYQKTLAKTIWKENIRCLKNLNSI